MYWQDGPCAIDEIQGSSVGWFALQLSFPEKGAVGDQCDRHHCQETHSVHWSLLSMQVCLACNTLFCLFCIADIRWVWLWGSSPHTNQAVAIACPSKAPAMKHFWLERRLVPTLSRKYLPRNFTRFLLHCQQLSLHSLWTPSSIEHSGFHPR